MTWRRRPSPRTAARPASRRGRAYPDETGYVVRDGVRVALGALRRGQPDHPADADVVDRPLAHVEGADPVSRPPLPGRSRSTDAATAAPTGRPASRPLRGHASSPPTPSPSWTRPAPTVPWSRACRWARASRCGSPSSARSASWACACSARPSRLDRRRRTHPDGRRGLELRRAAARRRRLAQVQRATTGVATGRASRPGSPARQLFSERALDQAGRGHRRLDARDRSRDDDRDEARAVPRAARRLGARAGVRGLAAARSLRHVACPALVVHGTDDHIIADRGIGRPPRRGARRAVRSRSRAAATPPSRASPCSPTC